MHLLTFIRIFNAAFGTRCIHVHLDASYFSCIFVACCILVHSFHKMHSCAFFVCCILYMLHLNAFQYIFSLVHFECSAFYLCCIQMHYHVFRCTAEEKHPISMSAIRQRAGDEDGLPVRLHHEAVEAGLDLSAAAGMRMHANAYICIRMHTNANECKRIHMNADECIHE